MKVSFLIIFIAMSSTLLNHFSQPSDPKFPSYKEEWDKIEELEQKGLIKDALKLCQNILAKAINERNTPQVYKSLMYIEGLSFQGNELGLPGVIRNLEAQLPRIAEVEKCLVQSVLGQLYWQFYLMHRRGGPMETKSISTHQDSLDLYTWSAHSLIAKSNEYYIASVRNPAALSHPLYWYRDILILGNDTLSKPTLFDILCQRAIQHFDHQGTQGIYFDTDLSPSEVLCSEGDFLQVNFNRSKHHHAAMFAMYQLALKVHKDNAEASFYLNQKRLQTARQIFYDENSKERFVQILNHYAHTSKNKDHAALWHLELASFYLEHTNFNLQDDRAAAPNYIKEIKQHLQNAEELALSEHVKIKIRQLSSALYQSAVSVELEKVQLPAQPFRMLVKYRNTKRVYFRLYKVPHERLYQREFNDREHYVNFILKEKPLRQWSESCPDPGDHLEHAFEIKVDALDVGAYFIAAGLHQNPGQDLGEWFVGFFQVSSLAPVVINDPYQATTLYVVDRKTGKPMKKVDISLLSNDYNFWKNNYDWKVSYKGKTDKLGKHRFNKQVNGQLLVENKNDKLWPETWISSYFNDNAQEYEETVLFTDRSIYRPGQVLHVKALLLRRDKNGIPKIIPNKNIKLELINPSGQVVETKRIKSNEYGSAAAHFHIPLTGLTGDYHLNAGNGSHSVKVEEYKRPNFEIAFDSLKTSYKLGDHVEITGKVVSFNQIPISGAAIKYRVYREQIFTYFPCWHRWIPPASQVEEIAQGSLTTQSDGHFAVGFKAKAPLSNPRHLDRSFQFSIQLDAVDITGETQSGSKTMIISEKPYFLTTNLKRNQSLDEFKQLELKAVNSSGVPLPCKMNIQISQLSVPNRWFRKRYWQKPDQFKYEAAQYYNWFPHDIYNDEDDPSRFPEERIVLSKSQQVSDQWQIANKTWLKEAGLYKIFIEATDYNGEKVNLTDYFEVVAAGKASRYTPAGLFVSHSSVQPGQTLSFGLAKTMSDYHGIISVARNHRAATYRWHKSGDALSKLVVEENDRGGLQVHAVTVLENCLFNTHSFVAVPWDNKKIDIVVESFRDKIQPGQIEKWKFKILGLDSVALEAELLASMYDAALDQIYPHRWDLPKFPEFMSNIHVDAPSFEKMVLYSLDFEYRSDDYVYPEIPSALNTFNLPLWHGYADVIFQRSDAGAPFEPARSKSIMEPNAPDKGEVGKETATTAQGDKQSAQMPTTVRKNFAENVFFYPDLKTDGKGNVTVEFVMSEALTRWKLQLLAHTMDMKLGTRTLELISQKPVQVLTYMPRSVRQGDVMQLKSKISNLTNEAINGRVKIQILDLITENDISSQFLNESSKNVRLAEYENIAINWEIRIPGNETRSLIVRTSFTSDNYSDSEQQLLPVLSNRQFITASLPLYAKGKSNQHFQFNDCAKALRSPTAAVQNFAVELTSHPIWIAIQSLPYLNESLIESSDNIMARIFGNAVSLHILEKYPRVKHVLNIAAKSEAFKSPLQQNEELKYALLSETPWLQSGLTETQQMKDLALLLDYNRVYRELDKAVQMLSNRQSPDGGFSWFPGGHNDPQISLQIVLMIGQLKKIQATSIRNDALAAIAARCFPYLDQHLLNIYRDLEKEVAANRKKWEDNNLGYLEALHLYVRSFFSEWKSDQALTKVYAYYLSQIQKYWRTNNIYFESMCGLTMLRNDNADLARLIAASLAQRAIQNPEIGTYWKNSGFAYYWYQLPIESHCLAMELFNELGNHQDLVDELKIWLLRNKQTHHWPSTKSTVYAVYTLLSTAHDWTLSQNPALIHLGDDPVTFDQVFVGSAYGKKVYQKSEIKPTFVKGTLKNANESIAWGALYVQYFDNIDKIESGAAGAISLNKELYIKTITPNGIHLEKPHGQRPIQLGDRLTIRMIIKADRPMEYVHLKDQLAGGLAPGNHLSGYHQQGRLWFYQTTGDLSTDFFISYLPSGTHVVEYDCLASHAGEYTNGSSTIQCMYAPEFAARTHGQKLILSEK